MDTIDVYKASEHNLKSVSLQIPRDKLVVFTGVSGSGKSSLAFDTIYAEAQRCYIESLSRHATQYLKPIEKPQFESISGLSPAISIDQKSVSRSPRSTVGTVTEIMDYLRVIYARIGKPHCSECQAEITPQSLEKIVATVLSYPEKSKIQILSPVVRGRKGDYNALFQQFLKEGYSRVIVDNEMLLLEELPPDYRLARHQVHDISLVIDRVVLKNNDKEIMVRVNQAVDKAMKKSDGFVEIDVLDSGQNPQFFSKHLACPNQHDLGIQEMAPRLFSFNSPYGACPSCDGIGIKLEVDLEKLTPDAKLSLEDGAIAPLSKLLGRSAKSYLKQVCKQFKVPFKKPFHQLTEAEKQKLFYGTEATHQKASDFSEVIGDSDDESDYDGFWQNMAENFDGVVPLLERKYFYGNRLQKEYIEQFMLEQTCSSCQGARLNQLSLSVTLAEKNIFEICEQSIDEAEVFFQNLPHQLSDSELLIARQAVTEIQARLKFLQNVGLGYLTLNRKMSTLSGGESQRIRLASQIGSGLSGVLYVLDEPSIGLHPYNNAKLIETLKTLRDLGNSVLVVEHDEATIRAADWLIDIGPGAGRLGGEILSTGTLAEISKVKQSPTGKFLRGDKVLTPPETPRKGNGKFIEIKNATLHNLKNVSVEFPLGTLTAVTGLSGSGKSTLVFDLLEQILRQHFGQHRAKVEGYQKISGIENIDKFIEIDQTPIGRTPRSNPATYSGLFDPIRKLFANSIDAKVHGYTPGHFSFNVASGRCPACKGDGVIKLEMAFLPNVYTHCETCDGKRYQPEILEVNIRGKSIADVLLMTVEDALQFFEDNPSIHKLLNVIYETGLGYITLGQSATTLSGGEAQRLKLATEFCKKSTGKTLYLLDEPTIGLHWQDLEKLLKILNKLVEAGNTVIVIEHDSDFIKMCDHVIDLGPEGGPSGGQIIATGTPKQVSKNPQSYTGQFLKGYF